MEIYTLVNQANSFQELNLALNQIYESKRLAKTLSVQSDSLQSIYEKATKFAQITPDAIQNLPLIDELMLLILQYNDDILLRGTLLLCYSYNQALEKYNEFQKRLEQKYISAQESIQLSVDLLRFKRKLEDLLKQAIQKTQIHLIIIDSQPSLIRAKLVCNKFLSASPLDNVLIQYHTHLAQKQIIDQYINLPSVYVYLGNNHLINNFSDILDLIQKTYYKRILKCFLTDIQASDPQRLKYNEKERFNFINDEASLYTEVKTFINEITEIQIPQCYPFWQKGYVQKTLSFLQPYSNLNSSQSASQLLDLKEKVESEYKLLFTKKENSNFFYQRFVESIWDCYENAAESQLLSLQILQNFLEFRPYVNKWISLQQEEKLNQSQNLIIAVFLAFNVYEAKPNTDSLFQVITAEKLDRCHLIAGQKLLMSSFNIFYSSQQRAMNAASQTSQSNFQVMLRYEQNDEFARSKNCTKTFKDKDGCDVIMSLPNQFQIDHVKGEILDKYLQIFIVL